MKSMSLVLLAGVLGLNAVNASAKVEISVLAGYDTKEYTISLDEQGVPRKSTRSKALASLRDIVEGNYGGQYGVIQACYNDDYTTYGVNTQELVELVLALAGAKDKSSRETAKLHDLQLDAESAEVTIDVTVFDVYEREDQRVSIRFEQCGYGRNGGYGDYGSGTYGR